MNALKIFTEKSRRKISTETMRRFNLWLGGLFALQAIIILILSANRPFAITASFLGVDTLLSQAQGKTVFAAGTHHLFDLNLAFLVAAALLVSAIAHVLAATKLRAFYEKELKKSRNLIRWIELALIGGLLLVTIAMLTGVQDISTLVMIFGLMLLNGLLGIMVETQNQVGRLLRWLSLGLRCFAGILPWLMVAIYAVANHVYGAGTPVFAKWLIASTFVLMMLIAANAYVGLRKFGHWADYLHTESVYLGLIFLVETAFAWQVFGGSLRP